MPVVIASEASFSQASSASIAIGRPDLTAELDLLLATIYCDGGTSYLFTTLPEGWQMLDHVRNGGVNVATFFKVAGASEPGSYTWTGNGISVNMIGTIVRVTGAHVSSPIAASDAAAQSGVLPSQTAATAGSGLIQMMISGSSAGWTPPGTTTERYDHTTNNAFQSVAGGDETVGVGDTGTRTWTNPSGNIVGGGIFAINPASSGGGGGGGTLRRELTFYPRNDTTVDTGGGADVRLLGSAHSATNDVTQTVVATNAQDNVERTFDPATAGSTAVLDSRTLQKLGWALRLAEDMTPSDDTLCGVVLPAQSATVFCDIGVGWSGSPLQNTNYTARATLFRYNPATDTGVQIATGVSAGVVVNILAANNTFQTVSVPITIPQTIFQPGEILLLQIGVNTGTLGNPLSGTINWTFTLRINNATTRLALAVKLQQWCDVITSVIGEGKPSRGALLAGLQRSVAGEGLPSLTRVANVSKTFTLLGEGAVALTKSSQVFRNFNLVGKGTVSRVIGVGISRTALGEGQVISAKTAVVSKTFNLQGKAIITKQLAVEITKNVVGEGLVTEVHPVQAFRSFDVVGSGEVLTSGPNGSTITLPLDELPTPEGGAETTIRPIFVFDD